MTTFIALLMILLTIVVYTGAQQLQKRFRSPLLHPALIASLIIIGILVAFDASYHTYMKGGKWISDLLNVSVVCLAYPLYQNRHKILEFGKVIFASVMAGVLFNFALVFTALKLLGYSKATIVTVLPRSITAAVGIQVTDQLGGTDTFAVLFIITTGMLGSMIGTYLLRLGRFETSIAKGLTYGNASHAFGTAKALEMDIESGAFSSIGMILTAIVSSILIPILIVFIY